MSRSIKEYAIISLKGMAMGAADVVPGVSGGTIAFISGIYEELLETISNVNLNLITTLRKEGVKATWIQVNGNFILSLFLGIAISVFISGQSLKVVVRTSADSAMVVFLWLGTSQRHLCRETNSKVEFGILFLLVFGAGIAYYITTLNPMMSENSSPWFLFLAGALAICAMILPGISGAFILVLLGAYKSVLEAVNDRDIFSIALVGFGAVVGLLSFSRVLKWLFAKYKNITLAVLTGFIIGSLNKIWPWKETLTWRTNSEGIQVPLKQISISPASYHGDAQLVLAIVLSIAGFGLILLLEKLAAKEK